MMKILLWFSANFFSKVVVGGDEKNPKYEDWSILFRILVKFLKQNPKWVNSRTATKKLLKVIWYLQQQWNQHYHRQMQNHPSNVMIKNKNSIIHFFTFNFPSTLRVHVFSKKKNQNGCMLHTQWWWLSSPKIVMLHSQTHTHKLCILSALYYITPNVMFFLLQ